MEVGTDTSPVVYRARKRSANVEVFLTEKVRVEFRLMGDLVAYFTFPDRASAIIFAESLIRSIDVI